MQFQSLYFQTLQQQLAALKTVQVEQEKAQAGALQQVVLAGKIVDQTKARYQPVLTYLEATRSVENIVSSFGSEPQRERLLNALRGCRVDVETFLLPWATAISNAEANLKHALLEAQTKEEMLQRTKRMSADAQAALQRNSLRLSPELLGRIFEWVVLDADDVQPALFGEYSQRPSILGNVCHTWRTVAYSRPSLWQNQYVDIGSFNSSIDRIRNHILLSNSLAPSVTIYGTNNYPIDLQAMWSLYQNTPKLKALNCYAELANGNTMSSILRLLPPPVYLRIISLTGLRRGTAGVPVVQIPGRYLQLMTEIKLEGVDPRWETTVWPEHLVQTSLVRQLTIVSATREPPTWLAYLLPQVEYLCYDLSNVTTQHPIFFKKRLKLLKLNRLATTWKSLIHWFPNNFEAPHLSSIVISNSWGLQCYPHQILACLATGLASSVKEVSIRSMSADFEGVCHFISRLTRLAYLELWGNTVDQVLSRLADRSQLNTCLSALQTLSICNYNGSGESILGFVDRRGAFRAYSRNIALSSAPLQNVYLDDCPNVQQATWAQIRSKLT